ncbi:MAG: hypothetical protein L0H31_15220, partial [Nocardioidaceae bacterium]|nr:hypothetical protein [Nocardioidaceae bacterium]
RLPSNPRPGLALGAAHRPGAFPLRPLDLGAIYDGAFRIIRFNPKSTIGAAVLVTSIAMILPVLITAVLTFTVGIAADSDGNLKADASLGNAIGLLVAYGSLLLALLLAQIGVIMVTGMIVHVARAAAVGRRLSLGEAWAATHGKRWRLIGLAFGLNVAFVALLVAYVLAWVAAIVLFDVMLVVLWGLVSVPAFLALCAWLWTRAYYLAAPVLMLEPQGVFGSIGRAWALTGRHFWRTFGIGLLTMIVGTIGGSMLAVPVSILSAIGTAATPEHAALILVGTQAVSTVVQFAFLAPFSAAVAALQYIDLRIRKDAFDVELMREAGLIGS